MCDCGKREMTAEELKLKEENAKLRAENIAQAEHICCLQKTIEKLNDEIIKLPKSPIECASLLIGTGFDYETNPLQRAFGAGEKKWLSLYSISDLHQIAEHLLVYCGHNEVAEIE